MKEYKGDIQDYFISILTLAFYFQFNMMEDLRKDQFSHPLAAHTHTHTHIAKSERRKLDGKIIESEFLACMHVFELRTGLWK
jgi:hypothetical protein